MVAPLGAEGVLAVVEGVRVGRSVSLVGVSLRRASEESPNSRPLGFFLGCNRLEFDVKGGEW